jgi:hypothetical protein
MAKTLVLFAENSGAQYGAKSTLYDRPKTQLS